jgi:hypothetical protein
LQFVAITPGQTEKFLGTYRARPELAIRILRDGENLYYYFVDNPEEKFYLGALSPDELFNPTESAQLKMVSIAEGQVQEIPEGDKSQTDHEAQGRRQKGHRNSS